jgi:hypothetical protein
VASGVDALYMSGRVAIPGTVIERLQLAREVAEEAEGPVGIEFGGVDFEILPRGLRMHKYRLEHEFGIVAFTTSQKLPAVIIQPRAEVLHRVGPMGVVQFYRNVIGRETGALELNASRLDLYIDVQGWDLSVDDRHRFVRRAKAVAGHEESEEFNGLAFGARVTKTVYTRIYDKTIEIEKMGGQYVEQTWSSAYDPSLHVKRVEFQMGRKGLRLYGIDSPEEAINSAPGLWRNLTTEWLTYRVKTGDSNRSRRPIAPEWHVVQEATMAHCAIGLDRMVQDHAVADLDSLRPALNGYVTSVAAIKGCRSRSDAMALVEEEIERYEVDTGRPFETQVAEKRGKRSFTIPESLR